MKMNFQDYTQFLDPCINYPSDNKDLNFGDYITACRQLIETYRVDLGNYADPQTVINANTPFEWVPPSPSSKIRYGALLLHGLFDSPFIMQDVGRHLHSLGLLTRAILLPGHGTVPGALLNVTYQDWLQATDYGIQNLSQDVDNIFLVGFSTGASLALFKTLQGKYDNIAGLILLAPAIQISPLGCISHLPLKLAFLSKRFEWLHRLEENDYVRYQSVTFNSAHQIYLLTQELQRLGDMHFLKQPVFVGISADDKTVNTRGTLAYFRAHFSKQSQILVYTSRPDAFQDTRVVSRPAQFDEYHIRAISHIAIPIAPHNSHYGQDGDYLEASHIHSHEPTAMLYGSHINLINHVRNVFSTEQHARLTWNPDFEFLLQAITRFVKKIMLT